MVYSPPHFLNEYLANLRFDIADHISERAVGIYFVKSKLLDFRANCRYRIDWTKERHTPVLYKCSSLEHSTRC